MFLIDDILLSPVNATVWIAKKIKEHVEGQYYNVEAVKAALEELRERHLAREITDEEFLKKEDLLLKNLQEAREYQKAKEGGEPESGEGGEPKSGEGAKEKNA